MTDPTGVTTASDVHLFDWIKQNGPFLGPIFLLFMGMAVGWVKVMVSRYPTRKEIHQTIDDKLMACKATVEKRIDLLDDEQHVIITEIKDLGKALNTKIDKNTAADNEAHERIIAMMVEKK